MTKSELIEQLATRTDLPKKRAEDAVNCVFDVLAKALAQGARIEIRGFGSFSLKEHRAYVGRNPKTGEEVPVEEKHSIHFKVGKQLRELVDQLPDPG
ncbi:MAG: integration host factor subunit beta [Myxococcales bacterium]|nr:integration host factor subunit beta [Myxococcales bacterium]MCB9520333.1 integration host factor subunit beta [Myxococcales bacterium]MCB9530986.1 integration host factor subunit beta [Myxococcales bacterium]MCB9532906.1 integration host factor subunit beta [Myxococcales bacterium]